MQINSAIILGRDLLESTLQWPYERNREQGKGKGRKDGAGGYQGCAHEYDCDQDCRGV